MIRGQRAEDALQILRFTKKRAAKDVEKVLRSAIANAERKAEDAGASLDVDHLFVSNCFVNEGSRWKRLRPAPMGRAFRYQRRTAHIVVGVAEHHVAAQERRGGGRGGSRVAEGRRRSRQEGPEGAGRTTEEERPKVVEEVAGGSFGTEDTSIRVSARLQQALEVALVRRPRLCRPAA